MRVGCGSATIGMFAKQWHGKVDEVVVVDDHITGVLSEHQAGKLLDIPDTGIKMKGRRSTPGRYFQVAEPGTGWGGTKISDPLSVLGPFDPKKARPGMTMLMVSTTGEHAAYYELDAALRPVEKPMPADLRLSVERIQENCEPALCTVLFMAGAGGSLRAGVTDNPVRLTRSVKEALTRVTSGGAPVYVWPGGGITFMVDVTRLPAGAFGYVPTPALVAPIEFTLRLSDYAALGGHMDHVRPLASLKDNTEIRQMRFAARGRDRAHDADAADRVSGRRQAAASAGRSDRPDRRGATAARREIARGLCAAARRFTGLLDELCDELPLLRQAADPARCLLQGRVARRMHAAVAPFAADAFHHADGGGRGRRRRRNSRRDAGERAGSSAPMSTMAATSRCIWRMASISPSAWWTGRTRPGLLRTMRDRCRRSRRAGLPPAAVTAAASRSASPMPSPCWRGPRRRPTPPPPSLPMRSICPGIPPSCAVRRRICSPTAISARAWSRAMSASCRAVEIEAALEAGADRRAGCSRRD